MGDRILLDLAIIIFCSKIMEAFSRKLKQPPVIGMLLLGVILGPSFLNLVESDVIIQWLAKLGVLFLLFEAGLETNLKQIKQDSRQALLPALGGITVPMLLGIGLSLLFNNSLMHSLTIGVIFTATSVSVSVMTLIDLGKLKGIEGRCIVNAAIIDDVIGILLVTFLFGMNIGHGESLHLPGIAFMHSIGKIVGFFVLIFLFGFFVLKPFFLNIKKFYLETATLSLAIAVIFVYAWLAEQAEIAAITGAYFAGLFIGQTKYKHAIQEDISTVGKSFFVDVFFVNIGLGIHLFKIQTNLIFLALFVFLAMGGKLIGSSIGARLSGFDGIRSLRIGFGMIPRGEVALIIANMAIERKLITDNELSSTIMLVIVSAFITPMLLKYSYARLQRKSFNGGGNVE